MNERFLRQLDFIKEVDKLKQIIRRSYLIDGSRRENDAEHTWHIVMMAAVLEEHAAEKPDMIRVIRMLLIHDLVEIDAGDTFAYDAAGYVDKFDRERLAAERIFHILPEDQEKEMMELWLEFEEGSSNDARFAAAMDRLQPILHNYATEGKSWREHGVTSSQVLSKIDSFADSVPGIGEWAKALIDDAVKKGYLLP